MQRPIQPRPLRPAPPDSSSSAASASAIDLNLPPLRRSSIAACSSCRAKRTKCDNRRPSCSRCLGADIKCIYDTREDETSTQALKRREHELQRQVTDLLELFRFLRERPLDEAQLIFMRIRVSPNPIHVLQSIKDAETLLAALQPKPSLEDDLEIEQQHNVDPIVVPAQPWTSVVSDEIVSELVTQFFTRDFYIFPAVDRDTFVADMKNQDPARTRICTPLLVSAICAVPCFHGYHSLVEIFFNESKKLLDDELGRPSLPSAMALYLMYLVSMMFGRDRAGMHFRHMSLEMLRCLDLETRFSILQSEIPREADERRTLSMALWGMFLAESRTSLLYHQAPLVCPPSVPRLFGATEPDLSSAESASMIDPVTPQQTPNDGVLATACVLAQLQYEIAIHNAQDKDRRCQNIQERVKLFSRWLSWLQDFSRRQQIDATSRPRAFHLRLYATQVVISLLQPLPLHTSVSDDSHTGKTIRSFYIQEAHAVAQTVNEDIITSQDVSSFLIGLALYGSLTTLLPILDDGDADSQTPELLHLGCGRLSRFSQEVPLFGRLLQAIGALAWRIGKQIPEQAQSIIDDLQDFQEDVDDIPMSFRLPPLPVSDESMEETRHEDFQVSQLGELITRWLRKRPAAHAVSNVLGRSSIPPN